MLYLFNIIVKWSASNNCTPLSAKTFFINNFNHLYWNPFWKAVAPLNVFLPFLKRVERIWLSFSCWPGGQGQVGSQGHFVLWFQRIFVHLRLQEIHVVVVLCIFWAAKQLVNVSQKNYSFSYLFKSLLQFHWAWGTSLHKHTSANTPVIPQCFWLIWSIFHNHLHQNQQQ